MLSQGTNGTDKNIKLITFKAHLRVHVHVVPVHTRPVQQSAVVITINTGETCVCVWLCSNIQYGLYGGGEEEEGVKLNGRVIRFDWCD